MTALADSFTETGNPGPLNPLVWLGAFLLGMILATIARVLLGY